MLKKLKAQLAALVAEANAASDVAVARAAAANEGLNAEETKAQEAFNTRIAGLKSLIAAEEQKVERASLVPVLDAGPVIEVDKPGFAKDPKQGFAHLGEFARSVKQAQDIARGSVHGRIDERLLATATPANFHTTQGEGAEIPPAMRAGIWEHVFADPLLGLIDIEPTSSPVVQVLSDETTPWGSSGVQARWRSEANVMTADKLFTRFKDARVHELYSFALVPEELLEDAPRLADRLARKMPQAIQWKLVEAYVTGTGAGQPLGWMNANNAGKIQVTRSGGGLIAVADVLGMFKRLLVSGADKPFWLTNRDTVSQLMTMVVGNQPVWMPPNGVAAAPGGTLLGLPVHFSDHAEALGTAGDLQLINPAGYYGLSRGAAKADSSIHLFYDYAITAFRNMVRFGGQPFLDAAVTAAKGPSKSHFIHLS